MTEGEADDALQNRVAVVLADFERERQVAAERAAEAERDRKLLVELETIRGNRAEHWDSKQTDVEYAAAFRGFGIDLDQLGPEEAGKRIAQRSEPVELASYLDDWSLFRRGVPGTKDEASWRRLLAAAQAADPDPWRVKLRGLIGRNDREAMRRLAMDQKTLEAQPARSLVLFASALIDQGDRDLAERALRRLWRREPGDFWVNFCLGLAQCTGSDFVRPEEAARYFSAAVAIRPRSHTAHNNLGLSLGDQGKLDEAIAEFREAIRIKPGLVHAHKNLGLAFRLQGAFSEAVGELRKARDLAGADSQLAQMLDGEMRFAEGHATLAARLPAVLRGKDQPKNAAERLDFGFLCYDLKRYSASARLFAEAFQADPKMAEDMQTQNRYNAACAAALAGSGQGKDEPQVAEAAKALEQAGNRLAEGRPGVLDQASRDRAAAGPRGRREDASALESRP